MDERTLLDKIQLLLGDVDGIEEVLDDSDEDAARLLVTTTDDDFVLTIHEA